MINFWSKSILRIDSIYKTSISNSQQSIKIDKITINMSLKSIIDEPKTILFPLIATKLITNQTPTLCKAKKSIAVMKLRKGMLTGTKIMLRKNAALNFLDLFVFIVLPNHKDFKFYNVNNVGCLSIGIKDLFIFPQLSSFYDRFPKDIKGTINVNVNLKNKEYNSLFYSGLLILLS